METVDARRVYKTKKRLVNKLVKDSKKKKWTELCTELEGNVWGDAYQIVMKKFGWAPYQLPFAVKIGIAEDLFPVGPGHGRPCVARRDTAPEFTAEELKAALGKLKNGTAAGPDGIPP